MKAILLVAAALVLLATGIAWQVYAFKDCKRVGHSTLYCVGRIGK